MSTNISKQNQERFFSSISLLSRTWAGRFGKNLEIFQTCMFGLFFSSSGEVDFDEILTLWASAILSSRASMGRHMLLSHWPSSGATFPQAIALYWAAGFAELLLDPHGQSCKKEEKIKWLSKDVFSQNNFCSSQDLYYYNHPLVFWFSIYHTVELIRLQSLIF